MSNTRLHMAGHRPDHLRRRRDTLAHASPPADARHEQASDRTEEMPDPPRETNQKKESNSHGRTRAPRSPNHNPTCAPTKQQSATQTERTRSREGPMRATPTTTNTYNKHLTVTN